ncbi:hypothetical protein AVEN_233370-1, partial [Araneus ventricosus]
PTVVYVEDRTSVQEDESGGAYKVDLQCVPSGWFVYDSMIWLKDGAVIYTETVIRYSAASEQRLQLNLTSPFRMENVSEFQGYYYCSVDLDNTYKPIYSPKLIVKFSGVHTFILHMKSEIPENSNYSDLDSLDLPFIEEFNKYLDVIYSNGSRLFLKDATCSGKDNHVSYRVVVFYCSRQLDTLTALVMAAPSTGARLRLVAHSAANFTDFTNRTDFLSLECSASSNEDGL